MKPWLLASVGLLAACSWFRWRADSPSPSECPTRPNCGQCAAQPMCGWCAAEKQCSPRGYRCMETEQITVVELCSVAPIGEDP